MSDRRRGRLFRARALALGFVLLAVAVPSLAAPSPTDPLPGSKALPNGWRIDPAGTQVLTSRAPTGVTVAPDGTAYAVTSGIFEQALERIDPKTLLPVKTLVGEAYQGVAADANGYVWVSGGPANAVFEYKAVGPAMIDLRLAGPLPDAPSRGIPVTGFPGTMLLAGTQLFVAGNESVPTGTAPGATCDRGSSVCSVINVIDVSDPLAASPAVHAIAVGRDAFGLAYRAASSTLYVSNWADQTNTAGANPYAGTGTVSVVRVAADGSGAQIQVVPVGLGPTGIALSPDGTTLAVADSDGDQLSLLSLDPGTGTVTATRTVDLHLAAGAPLGTTPLAVAYSKDGSYLYVALAGIDAIEVLRADGTPIPQTVAATFQGAHVTVNVPATFIPTGWYPDALAVGAAPDGGTRLYVANLRGDGSGPGYYAQTSVLVGTTTEGTLSVIDVAAASAARAKQLNAWTARVVSDDDLAPVWAGLPDPASDACLPVRLPGGTRAASTLLCDAQRGTLQQHTGPVHVVMILAENKTFDSYFGDTKTTFPGANADPAFTEYPSPTTTNQHALARAFTLSDAFSNEGAEASVLGHSWFSGGYSSVANEMLWNDNYDEALRGDRPDGRYAGTIASGTSSPDVAAVESTMLDPRTRLADEAYTAGLSVRVYGTDLNRDSPSRADQLSPSGLYWGVGPGAPTDTDLSFPDTDRANLFLHGHTVSHAWDALQGPPPPTFDKPYPPAATPFPSTFTLDGWNAQYRSCVASGGTDAACQTAMPSLTYMTLPENHTYDLENTFNPLDPTPQSMVADNDYAIGLVVDGLSHSPFWKNTIVFLTEDDNQFTGDHVDVHRTFLLTMGGLARRLGQRREVSHQVGSFPSVLKTVELLLGLQPLTLFDWRAVPLQDVVAQRYADIAPVPYAVKTPVWPFLGRGVG